jgi:hypothetical protein
VLQVRILVESLDSSRSGLPTIHPESPDSLDRDDCGEKGTSLAIYVGCECFIWIGEGR